MLTMKQLKIFLLLFTLSTIVFSCTRVIDLNLGNNSGLLVIEGNVTNQLGTQYITLSKNVDFTSTNTYPPVSGATVSVTDSKGNTFNFLEGPAGTYSNGNLLGLTDITYTMYVTISGKTYTAVSKMPNPVILDSITSKTDNFFSKKNQRQITVHFLDPYQETNQYRFLMFVNNVQVKSIFALNDSFTDGRYVNLDLRENDIDVLVGDTVKVEMQNIDTNMYTYWYTLQQQKINGPGGGVTPTNPPTNITPATLGYFSAHTTQTKTIVVK